MAQDNGTITVTREINDDGSQGLFAGQKLWFSHACPARTWLMQNAEANGAIVVSFEHQADIVLVDHAKKLAAPGTFSYKYVELSIRNGQLEHLQNHHVGSTTRAGRLVGSSKTAVKEARYRYTDADEQLLWNWVQPVKNANGMWKGNRIYQQLERHNSRHTYQSWRDRFIKYTQYQNREITARIGPAYEDQEDHEAVGQLLSPSPQKPTGSLLVVEHLQADPTCATGRVNGSIQREEDDVTGNNQSLQGRGVFGSRDSSVSADKGLNTILARVAMDNGFSAKIARELFKAAPHVLTCHQSDLQASWEQCVEAGKYPQDAEAWRVFFEEQILPIYRDRNGLRDEQAFAEHIEAERERLMPARYKRIEGWPTKRVNNNTTQRNERPPETSLKDRLNTEEHHQPIRGGSLQHEHLRDHDGRDLSAISSTIADFVARCDDCLVTIRATNGGSNAQNKLVCGDCGKTAIATRATSSPPESGNTSPKHRIDSGEGVDQDRGRVAGEAERNDAEGDSFVHSQSQQTQEEPDANASGARSQGHTTQSDSQGKSQPRSQTHSNTTGSVHDIPYRTDSHPVVDIHAPLLRAVSNDTSLSEEQQKIFGTRQSLKRKADHSDIVTNAFNKRKNPDWESTTDHTAMSPLITQIDETPGQDLVTQMSVLSKAHSMSSSHIAELRDESPLFFPEPEESDDGRQQLVWQETDTMSDKSIGVSQTQLLDGEDLDPDPEESQSQYAPSEAPSDAPQFDTSPELSQAWATLPEEPAHYRDVMPQSMSPIEPTNSKSTAHARQKPASQDYSTRHSALSERYLQRSDSASDPVLEAQLRLDASTSAMIRDEDTKVRSEKRSTQALLQESLPMEIAHDSFRLPPPEGGWMDDDDFEIIDEQAKNVTDTSSSRTKRESAKPQLLQAQNQATGDREDEMNQWFEQQNSLYPEIEKAIRHGIIVGALESTSSDIQYATAVVESMAREFLKGKHALSVHISSVDNLVKNQSNESRTMTKKAARDELIAKLLPDARGVWTKRDDAWLTGTNARHVEQIVFKHGENNVAERFEYLSELFRDE